MPDAIVVGAGHNGLVAANILADHGWDVVVLESHDSPGGAVRTEELTRPGFRHDLFSAFYPLAAASPVISSLDLEEHGLSWCRAPRALAHPLPGGRSVAISGSLEETAASLDADARGDGDAWRAMLDRFDHLEPTLIGALLHPFPPIRDGLGLLRRLGTIEALRLVRDLLLPVRRMGEEWFSGEGAALLLGGSASHTDLSPENAASGAFGWLLCCLAQRVGFPVPRGGAGSLVEALEQRLRSRGGDVQCRREVTEVIVRRGRAVGVRTRDGDELEARRAVLAAVSAPALYLSLVDEGHLPASVIEDVRRFHWDSSTVKVDWALDGAVPWESAEVRLAGTVHVADTLDELTQHFASLAMKELPARPFLVFGQQATADASRAPAGKETAWAYTHVPREVVRDGAGELSPEGEKWVEGFVERIEERVEAHAAGFRSLILGRHVFSPSSIEATDASLSSGAINGGTAQPHQQLVFRPIVGFGRAETPVSRLYLASSSAHPGGGVHGAAGANAARAALAQWPRLRAASLGRGGSGLLLPHRRRTLQPDPAVRPSGRAGL